MACQRIHVEHLKIRFSGKAGATPAEARVVAEAYGRETLRRLADAAQRRTGRIHIDGVVTTARPANAGERIGAAVRAKLDGGLS
jgi:hypothetical protein